MRIGQLSLTRYGHFSGRTLDFGPAPDGGQPDLHLIFGPNEAGKSTLTHAVLDFLFGYQQKNHPYAFHHDVASLRIGARLSHAGREREVHRLRSGLVDAGDRALEEDSLAALLGGIDRSAAEAMFVLDDRTLEAGGEAVLDAKGDVGSLLFAATAGLPDLARRIATLRETAEKFYRKAARNTRLSELTQHLTAVQQARKAADTDAGAWEGLALRDSAAQAALEVARDKLKGLRDAAQHRRRLLAALPVADSLREAEARRDAIGPVPDLPQSWGAELARVREDITRLATARDAALAEVARAEADLAALPPDDAILVRADAVAALQQATGSRASLLDDLPRRKAAREVLRTGIAALMAQLAPPATLAPRDCLLPEAVLREVTRLLDARAALAGAEETAAVEVAAAAQALAGAEAAAAAVAQPGDWDADALRALVTAARPVLDPARAAEAARRRSEAAGELAQALRRLAPWSGSPETLAAQTVPAADAVREAGTALEEGLAQARLRTAEVTRLGQEAARQQALNDAETATGTVIGDAEAAAIRAARDVAWATLVAGIAAGEAGAMLTARAEAFAAAAAAHDGAADLRLAAGAALGRLRAGVATLADLAARIAAVEAAGTAAQPGLDRQAGALMATARALGLPDDTPAERLARWLEDRAAALARADALAACMAEDTRAAQEVAGIAARLDAALAAAGVLPDPARPGAEALERAALLLQRRDREAAAQERAGADLRAARRAAETRGQALAEARQRLARCDADLAALLADGWLAPQPPARLRLILADLGRLAALVREEDDLSHRIAAMEGQLARFDADLAALTDALGETPDPAAPDRLQARLQAARAVAAQRATRAGDAAAARLRAAEAGAALTGLQARVAEMAEAAGAVDLTGLEQVLDRAQRAQAVAAVLRREETELVRLLGAGGRAEALAQIAAADRAALEAGDAASAPAIAAAEAAVEAALLAAGHAAQALAAVGADGQVARLEEERAGLLLDLADGARRSLALRLGCEAAEAGLRLYRDRHRSRMMLRAAEAFRALTLGSFTDLETRPRPRGGEVLVAIDADGRAIESQAMSKGTRIQLYLALRLAGYREFSENRVPLPFIADDVFESFDEERTAAAFGLLAGIATTGQVIYLTHHAHLVALARSVVAAGLTVHTLPPRRAAQ